MTRPIKILLGVLATMFCLGSIVVVVVAYVLISFLHGRSLFDEGYAAISRRDYETAATKFAAALGNRLPKMYRAYALADLALSESWTGHCNDAIRDYTKALQLDPNLAFAYENRGQLYDESGEREKAYHDYSQAIRLDPNSHRALFDRGLINLERKDLDQAIEDFSEAVRTDPSSAAAYNNRGLVYSYKKDFDRALSNFDAAIQLRPNYASALGDRGYVYFEKKQYEKAIADLTEAIRLDPKHEANYRLRGFCLKDDRRFKDAIADFNKALQLNPKDIGALEGRAATFSEMGKHDDAIADFNAVLQTWQLPDVYYRRAAAYSRKGDYSKALTDFREALRLEPDDQWALNNFGWFLATCPDAAFRDGKEALVLARKACEISNWKNASSLDTLAAACALTGDFEAAVGYEDRAISLNDLSKSKIAEMQTRRALYQQHKPFQQTRVRSTD